MINNCECLVIQRSAGWDKLLIELADCRFSFLTLVHKDDSQWAGVLYLTPGADPMSGTGIFDEEDTLITLIGNVYNRLVLYRGDLFHRSLMPGFGTDVSTGRLTQVFFFNIIE